MEYYGLNGVKCGCGNDKFFFKLRGKHIGAYCSKCGKWVKWCNKYEANISTLFFSQFRKRG